MSATAYAERGFGGAHARFGPGLYRGDLPGGLLTARGDPFPDPPRSLRVDPGTAAYVAPGPAERGGRVVLGPAEVADVAALGLPGGFGVLRVAPCRPRDLPAPWGDGAAEAAELPGGAGRTARLDLGDYAEARLRSDEVGLRGGFGGLRVAGGAAAVLYAGPAFGGEARLLVGPADAPDLERLGFAPRSLRLLETPPPAWGWPAF